MSSKDIKPAPEGAPYDKYAFAEERGEDVPWEEDNQKEHSLYTALASSFDGGWTLSPDQCTTLKRVLSMGWYSDVFGPPKTDEVYRGMVVSAAWLKTALKVPEDQDLPGHGHDGKRASFTFKPKFNGLWRGSSSWTSRLDVAQNFGNEQDLLDDADFAVVLTASVSANPDSLVSCAGGLYDMPDFDKWSFENEVIALGDVKVSYLQWHRRSSDRGLGEFGM